jgi:hypothetical protein
MKVSAPGMLECLFGYAAGNFGIDMGPIDRHQVFNSSVQVQLEAFRNVDLGESDPREDPL